MVERAQNGQTITFKELAEHFGIQSYMIFGQVCGITSTAFYELEEEWGKGRIPRITNLVMRSDGAPSGFIASALTDEAINEYRETELKPIWEYPHWDVVKNVLELKGKIHDIEVELVQTRKVYVRLIR